MSEIHDLWGGTVGPAGPARRRRRSPSMCGTASPDWRTAGRGSTDRRAPRSSTPRSTPPADWQRSGNNANSHGAFAAAEACDALAERAQETMGELLGADPAGFVFGPSTTNNVFSITRAIARELRPGDEIVCTRLDHDSNVSPWLLVGVRHGCNRATRRLRHRNRPARHRHRRRVARRADPVGGGDRCLERDRHDARHRGDHGRRPRGRAPRSSSTASTSHRTPRSTSPRSAATCTRRRRTSGTARTPASRGSNPSCSTGCRSTRCARRPDRARTAATRHAGVRIAGRHRRRRPVPARRRHDSSRRPRAGPVQRDCSTACWRCRTSASSVRTIRPTGHRRWHSSSTATPRTRSPAPLPPSRSPSGTAITTPSS